MCTDCEIKLCLAFDFKNLCERTETALRKLVHNAAEQTEIKTDIDIPDYDDFVKTLHLGDSESDEQESKKDCYTCKICDRDVHSKKEFLSHMRRHTSDENEFNKLIGVQESINAAIKKHFECKYCHKVLTTAVGLKIHTRRHTGINLHVCNVSQSIDVLQSNNFFFL